MLPSPLSTATRLHRCAPTHGEPPFQAGEGAEGLCRNRTVLEHTERGEISCRRDGKWMVGVVGSEIIVKIRSKCLHKGFIYPEFLIHQVGRLGDIFDQAIYYVS